MSAKTANSNNTNTRAEKVVAKKAEKLLTFAAH